MPGPSMTCPRCLGRDPELFYGLCGWCGGSGQVPGPRPVTLAMRDVHEGIKLWHDGHGQGLELHQFLGLTWLEYAVWVNYHRLPDHSTWFDPRELRHDMAKETLRLG